MKKFMLKTGEVLCVILLVLFIVHVSSQDKMSSVPFEEVQESVISAFDTEGLLKRDALKLKKQFSLDAQQFRGFTYYSSDSVMDVREVLVIALSDLSQQESVMQSLKEYATEKQKVFDGYAPEESELLSSHILEGKGGYVLFCVGPQADKATDAFYDSL